MSSLCARILSAVFCCAALCAGAAEMSHPLIVEPQQEGEFDFDPATGQATADHGVVVRYEKAALFANRVTVNQQTGEVLAEGKVRLEHEGETWIGERAVYNFQTRQLHSGPFRSGQPPFFITGESLAGGGEDTNRAYFATNAVITTDDYAVPAYTVRAKQVKIIPGKSITARHPTFWIGKVPVLWLPRLQRSLGGHPNNWVLTPGYRSRFGPYLLTTYNSHWNERLSTAIHMDGRVKRGLAGGADAAWRLDEAGEGEVRYYYAYDLDPDAGDNQGYEVPKDRQRVWFTHRIEVQTNFTAKAVLRWQSDPYVVRDFFETEYRDNAQPSTFVEAIKDWRNWSLDLYAQPRVNDYQETIERIPEVRLTGLRQELGESPFYYESESSFGYYRHLFPDMPTNSFYPYETNAYAAMRGDTYHQILIPWNFFGWLNVAPRAGARFTYYGESDGEDVTTSEEMRGVFNTGVEANFKASRVWQGARNRLLDVQGLRHIVEPGLNYAYVPRPSVRPRDLPQFDTELPSYRLLPIDYPDYNSIDSIDSQNVLRMSLRNKFQTKREGRVDNLANWAVYTDWRLNPDSGQGTFADIYSDLDFKPRSWLTLNSEIRFNPQDEEFSEANHWATIRPGDVWSFSIGHRYLRETPEFGWGNNTIFSSLYFRLSENWAFRTLHHFEARDGVMEEQSYTIYRDLRSWTMALIFRVRESRSGSDDFGVAVTFSLKAAPRFRLNDDVNRPSLLLGS